MFNKEIKSTNYNPCILCDGVFGLKGNYTPKWKVRVCFECRAINHDGHHSSDFQMLLDAGVPKNEIFFNSSGYIIIPHFSEL